MKNNYFLVMLFAIAMISFNVNAQFEDDMESYTDGQPIIGAHWTDWGCGGGAGCAIMSSSAQAHEGLLSGYIPTDGTTDAVLDLGNKTFLNWGLKFWMYIPTDREGYFNVQGAVPITTGIWAIGNIIFNEDNINPGAGYIDYSAFNNPELWDSFTFPHDQWFEVILNVDISTGMGSSTFQFIVDGVTVADWKPFAGYDVDLNLVYPPALGGIDFFSITTNNEYWVDTFSYIQGFHTPSGIDDLEAKGFAAYPNPVKDVLNLRANENIDNVDVYNLLGQRVYSIQPNSISHQLDMSSFDNGAYFVKVVIGDSEGTTKVVK